MATIKLMFATAASVVGHIKGGKVRALAVTTLKRTAVLPDVPTMDEAGLKGFDAKHLARAGGAHRHAAGDRRESCSERGRSRRCNDPGVQASLGRGSASISSATHRSSSKPISRRNSETDGVGKASGATMDK